MSYRREDTKSEVTYLAAQLQSRYGSQNVFVDYRDIPLGMKWAKVLRDAVQNCSCLLAIVGKEWGKVTFRDGEKQNTLRLFDEHDWVRKEICTALEIGKPVLVVLIDDATLPTTIWGCELDQLPSTQHAQIRHQQDFQGDFDKLCKQIERLAPELLKAAKAPARRGRRRQPGKELSSLLLNTSAFGVNLLENEKLPGDDEEEGVILIKPGGTYYGPCLDAIFSRLQKHGRIVQVKLFDGETIARQKLFEQQYATPAKLANGEIKLSQHDFLAIRKIYDVEDFKQMFGVPYDDSLVEPALLLCERLNVSDEEMTRLWDAGRSPKLFWNSQFDGLNKIGYQKSVFPIRIPIGETVVIRIVVNGYMPGYRKIYVHPESRLIAIHFAAICPWKTIREEVVGGSSKPDTCLPNSIRYDAAIGKIPLDPKDNIVNGQRNVCHSSGSLLDGMNELMIWFGRLPEKTRIGTICARKSIPVGELIELIQGRLWEVSWWHRDETIDGLLCELQSPQVADHLNNSLKNKLTERYVSAANSGPSSRNSLSTPMSNSLVSNGARLERAGISFYTYRASKLLRNEPKLSNTFHEVVNEIRIQSESATVICSNAVLAEAVRIAASDLQLLSLPVYRSEIAAPELFRARVISELPNQALDCAKRTEYNYLQDVRAHEHGPSSQVDVSTIHEHPDWQWFLTHQTTPAVINASVLGLILCGGRSTRMASTIPKPLLPFRGSLLLYTMLEKLRAAFSTTELDLFAAVGFRGYLFKRAVANGVKLLDFEKTLGVGFRAATCLYELRKHSGLTVLAYVDTPSLPRASIGRLVKAFSNSENPARTFGMLTSASNALSGHIVRDSHGSVTGVVQDRTDRVNTNPLQDRDAGLYLFHNTPEFREILARIRNNNVRGEFIFADVIALLSAEGWVFVEESVPSASALGINTAGELLCAVTGLDNETAHSVDDIKRILRSEFGMELESNDADLDNVIRSHCGPIGFLHWWDKDWR